MGKDHSFWSGGAFSQSQPSGAVEQAVRSQQSEELGSVLLPFIRSTFWKAGSQWLQEHEDPVLAKWLLTSLVDVRHWVYLESCLTH